MAVSDRGQASYERLPTENTDGAKKKKKKIGKRRPAEDEKTKSSPSGQQEKAKMAPIRRFWEFVVRFFEKGDRKVGFEEKRNIAGREREAFIKIRLDREVQYDKMQKRWILSVLVKQMDFGIVNSCCKCSESGNPCQKCKDNRPFIHMVSMCVKPNSAEGTLVENVLGKPWNRPQKYKITSGQNVALQIPVNLKNALVTVQSSKTTAVEGKQHGWNTAILPPKGGEAVTLTWQLSTWENGDQLNFNKRLPSSERELPVNPRHVQIHPESLSEEPVGGEWHIKNARKPHLRHMTFDIEVKLHTAVSKRSSLSGFFGFAANEADVLSHTKVNLRL